MDTIDQDLLCGIVRSATRNVFVTMLGLEPSCSEPYIEKAPAAPTEGVVSLVGLAGQWVGTGTVSCSAHLACQVSSRMLATPIDSVGEEVLDVVAELTNMIIGNVKTSLEEHLGALGLSIPTVVFGKNFTTKSVGDGQWSVFPFLVEQEVLEVKLCLTPNRKPSLPVRPGFPHTYSLEG
jgi:chemotaxis protein CheX